METKKEELHDEMEKLHAEMEKMPDQMKQFTIGMRALFAQKAVGMLKLPVFVDFREIRDATRKDAIVYRDIILPISKKFMVNLSEYCDYYQALEYEEWAESLEDIVKEVGEHKDLCVLLISLLEDLIVPHKKREDEAEKLGPEFKNLKKKYMEKAEELEVKSNTKIPKLKSWLAAIAVVVGVAAIIIIAPEVLPIVGPEVFPIIAPEVFPIFAPEVVPIFAPELVVAIPELDLIALQEELEGWHLFNAAEGGGEGAEIAHPDAAHPDAEIFDLFWGGPEIAHPHAEIALFAHFGKKQSREQMAKALSFAEKARVNDLAILCLCETLLPALKNFIKGLTTIAGVFEVLETELMLLLRRWEQAGENSKSFHYNMMKKHTESIQKNCEAYLVVLPDVRTHLAALPTENMDKNYVDKWLENQLEEIKKEKGMFSNFIARRNFTALVAKVWKAVTAEKAEKAEKVEKVEKVVKVEKADMVDMVVDLAEKAEKVGMA